MTIVKVVMQTIMTNDQSLLNSIPMISVPMYPMSISARAIVAPAAMKIKSENRQDIRTTYRLYRGTFPLLILLAVMPIRFMKTFYHYGAITQGLGPYLLPQSFDLFFRHADTVMDIGMAAQNKRSVRAFGIGLQDLERFDTGVGIETGQMHILDPPTDPLHIHPCGHSWRKRCS